MKLLCLLIFKKVNVSNISLFEAAELSVTAGSILKRNVYLDGDSLSLKVENKK